MAVLELNECSIEKNNQIATDKIKSCFLDILKNNKLDHNTLDNISKILNISLSQINLLFPLGVIDIISEISKTQDLQMLEIVNKHRDKRVTGYIIQCLQVRLSIIGSKKVVAKLLGYLIMTNNIGLAFRLGFKTCNLMWRSLNDDSSDFNFYTKRGVLLSLYIQAILFYISSKKENEDVNKYIENIVLNRVNSIKKLKSINILNYIPFVRLWF